MRKSAKLSLGEPWVQSPANDSPADGAEGANNVSVNKVVVVGGDETWKAPGRNGKLSTMALALERAVAAQREDRIAREMAVRFSLPDEEGGVIVTVGEDIEGMDGAEEVGRKRKARPDGGGGAREGEEEEEVLFRLNFDEFDRRFRHQICVDLVREKINPEVGELLTVFLDLTRPLETVVKQDRSVPFSVQDLKDELGRRGYAGDQSTPGARIDPNDTQALLDTLEADTSELISKVGEAPTGNTYCINLRRIVDLARVKSVEAVVKERFGVNGCRIFRLLTMKRQLEQEQIGEMCMVPVRITRELLYKLLKAQYVSLQEVAKTADHAPSRTFYLWRVDVPRVIARLSKEICKLTLNVKLRLEHERRQAEERGHRRRRQRVVELVAGRPSEGAENGGGGDQSEEVERWLRSELMKLDEQLMLFNDI